MIASNQRNKTDVTRPSILYLLKVGFTDPALSDRRYFCPYCMQVEGLLASFPKLREQLHIEYVDFQKPRGGLADFCGEQNQSCPQLIFPDGDDAYSSKFSEPGLGKVQRIHQTASILDYLVERFELPLRH